jgi:hypothetical protein
MKKTIKHIIAIIVCFNVYVLVYNLIDYFNFNNLIKSTLILLFLVMIIALYKQIINFFKRKFPKLEISTEHESNLLEKLIILIIVVLIGFIIYALTNLL